MTANAGAEKAPDIRVVDGAPDDAARVSQALGAEIAERFAPPETAPLSILAYENDALVGGLTGVIHWRWLYIRHFWINERARGRGLGRALIERARTTMEARGGAGVYLDTFDTGAATFYERCGFRRFGAIADFPPGHQRVFLCMNLSGTEAEKPTPP
jgi:GNAT superfamily N-acetyltransferase